MNLFLFSPEISLVCFAVLVILVDLFIRQKGWLAVLSIVGLLVSATLSSVIWNGTEQALFNGMLAVDNYAVFFKLLFAGIAILVILASSDYISRFRRFQGEFYALILLSTLGMMLMASTTELISLFVSLELVNLSLYALVGFLKEEKSGEASLKYLLLSAVASAILLFGMALVFGLTGKTQLGDIARSIQAISSTEVLENPALILGILMMLAGFGFKIAMVPLHMWVPDVYEGAPTPVTAYLSVGSKSAGFAIILRVFYSAFSLPQNISLDWGLVLAILAALSMTAGNVIALQQENIKRMLGYSSIAQAGYILVGMAAVALSPVSSTAAQSSILFFLAAYSLTNLGAFIAIIAISNKINSDEIKGFSGMGKRSPLTAIALTLCLISLIGLPPAAGFMAKFYIFSTAVQYDLLWLVVVAVINSVISAYYYLRVVKVMWMDQPASTENIEASSRLRLALFLCCLGVLLFFFVPDSLMQVAGLAKMLGL
ncbi:MAG: NADH-quinone oxidoreductase subunit N [Dehalococcoidales bacterium]|nr:NADH-quinone oxidoreductase subunit N [Dehalococcoidales bacterium]